MLELIENDPDPGLRHKLIRLMILNPPFEWAHRHRLDVVDLVDRIWMNIKYTVTYFLVLRVQQTK